MNLSSGALTSRFLTWHRSHATKSRLWLLFYLSPGRAEYSGLRGAPGYVYCETGTGQVESPA